HNQALTAAGILLLSNRDEIIPLKNLSEVKIAYLALGVNEQTPFQKGLSRYLEADQHFLPAQSSLAEMLSLQEKLQDYDRIIVGVHNLTFGYGVNNLGITAEMNLFLKELVQRVPS